MWSDFSSFPLHTFPNGRSLPGLQEYGETEWAWFQIKVILCLKQYRKIIFEDLLLGGTFKKAAFKVKFQWEKNPHQQNTTVVWDAIWIAMLYLLLTNKYVNFCFFFILTLFWNILSAPVMGILKYKHFIFLPRLLGQIYTLENRCWPVFISEKCWFKNLKCLQKSSALEKTQLHCQLKVLRWSVLRFNSSEHLSLWFFFLLETTLL